MLLNTFIVPENLTHTRIDKALAFLLDGYSRVQIQRWIKAGCVTINQHVVKTPSVKVNVNDQIILQGELDTGFQSADQAENLPLDIIFEDKALLIINKPAGLIVHPGAGNAKHTLVNGLLYHFPSLKQLPRAGLIHRLDKDTSGLLIVAKTPASYQQLTCILKDRDISREYRAVVKGVMISGGTIDAPIGRHTRARTQMAVRETGGKPAITTYRILKKFQAHTYLSIFLDTGRTHQIRVHLMHIHHPVLGDQTYGKRIHPKGRLPEHVLKTIQSFKRQALHAFRLKFKHPVTGDALTFVAPLPEDMQTLIDVLGSFTAI